MIVLDEFSLIRILNLKEKEWIFILNIKYFSLY